jgi:hypothetical protein
MFVIKCQFKRKPSKKRIFFDPIINYFMVDIINRDGLAFLLSMLLYHSLGALILHSFF